MRYSTIIVSSVFAISITIPGGCKGNKDRDDAPEGRAVADRAKPAAAAAGADTVPLGDGSVAAKALARLIERRSPALGENPLCREYRANMSSFFKVLDVELKHLQGAGGGGISRAAIGRFAAAMSGRAKVLDRMSTARALTETSELSRLHRELAAAATDLSESLGAAYGPADPPGSELAERVSNAVDNFISTLAALEKLCRKGP